MRRTHSIAPEDSIAQAARTLRENGAALLPVVQEQRLLGVVTEAALGRALANGAELTEAAGSVMVPAPTVAPYVSGAEALRRLDEGPDKTLVVVDDQGNLMGLLSPTDLYPRRRVPPRPAAIGGMATPFGVYLTTGAVSGGPPKAAMILTGMVLFGLMLLGALLSMGAAYGLAKLHAPIWAQDDLVSILTPVLFLLGMRLVPLAGIHAAEHQVVHAIERGEELRPEVVRRMPRVHPRCGTNLAAGAALFLGVFECAWIPWDEVRILLAFLVTLFFWKPLGSFLQRYATTRPPSEKQIRMGIRSGEQLLSRYAESAVAVPGIPARIWNSGLLHVLTGSVLCLLLVKGICALFNISLPIE